MAIRIKGDRRFMERKIKNLRKSFPEMLEDMSVRAENHFADSFRNEGFTDDTLQKWPKRKSLGRYDDAARSNRRALLVKTGKMRNATRVRKLASRKEVRVFNDAKSAKGFPYPKVHNEGLGNMPKRQFIGNSRQLNRKIKKDIVKTIKRALTGK
jgi:hypothetical protein